MNFGTADRLRDGLHKDDIRFTFKNGTEIKCNHRTPFSAECLSHIDISIAFWYDMLYKSYFEVKMKAPEGKYAWTATVGEKDRCDTEAGS